jgi:hypothetical protein
LARFSLSAIESSREDIIGEPAASTLRLNAFAISVRHHPSERRFTLHWNRAPQKDALFLAQMQYFKRESETSLSARLT